MTVSIAIVAYNEEKTIKNLLSDIEKQTYPKEKIEIILVDSCSTDRTKLLMEEFSKTTKGYKSIQVLDNPKKNLPSGCNVALLNYTGDAIIRIDGHATIPKDFIEKNVRNIENGEMVSGGKRPNIIDGDTPWKKTLLMAETSMFGSSAASYRRSDQKRYVDSVFHGMYKREVFDRVGLYNENLVRTEDNEMSYRIREAGINLCYDPDIVSYEHTRGSLQKMLRQKYLNGYWIGLTLGVCPGCLSIFHFVPFMFVMAIILTAIIACFGLWLPMVALWGMYLVLNIFMTIQAIVQEGFNFVYFVLPVLFLLLHLSYGAGTLWGLISLPVKLPHLRKEN